MNAAAVTAIVAGLLTAVIAVADLAVFSSRRLREDALLGVSAAVTLVALLICTVGADTFVGDALLVAGPVCLVLTALTVAAGLRLGGKGKDR